MCLFLTLFHQKRTFVRIKKRLFIYQFIIDKFNEYMQRKYIYIKELNNRYN